MLAVFPGQGILFGAIAQLVAHLLCKQGVAGSIPAGSTETLLSMKERHCPRHSLCGEAGRMLRRVDDLAPMAGIGRRDRLKIGCLVRAGSSPAGGTCLQSCRQKQSIE